MKMAKQKPIGFCFAILESSRQYFGLKESLWPDIIWIGAVFFASVFTFNDIFAVLH